MTQRAIVVGAGIVGCLVARELAARAPGASITVLDRDAVGAGASRRSAGLHLLRGHTPRVRRMSAESHRYYAELMLTRPGLPVYPLRATVITDGTPPSGDYLEQAAPVPAGEHAWQIAGSHYGDVYRLTQALAAELRPRARFGEGVAVTGITAGPPGLAPVTVQAGTGEQFAADAVVLAPGPWVAHPAWRDLVAPLGLRVKKIVALHIERPPDPADAALVLDAEDAFLLPVSHRGHWLFSYTCTEWDVDPDQLSAGAGLSRGDLGAALDCLRRHVPQLADACRGGRVFCDAYSPSREPVVCALDPAGRIVFAGAANGSGYRLAPAIAAEAVDLLAPALGQPARATDPAATTPSQAQHSQTAQHSQPARRSEGAASDHEYV
jgi:glycine/D-amino acid oxidase-like deaminating enzyme